MIAQKFVFSIDFVTDGNTDCRSEEISFRVGTKIKRGIVILMSNVVWTLCRLWPPNRGRTE